MCKEDLEKSGYFLCLSIPKRFTRSVSQNAASSNVIKSKLYRSKVKSKVRNFVKQQCLGTWVGFLRLLVVWVQTNIGVYLRKELLMQEKMKK